MVTAVIIAVITMAPVVGSLVVVASWAMNARILVEAHFGLFGGCYHLADPLRRLAIELGAEVAVMASSNEGGDDLFFRDVGNRIPHLGKASDVATEELGWLLVNAVQIMLGAWPSTRSHVVVVKTFFSSS